MPFSTMLIRRLCWLLVLSTLPLGSAISGAQANPACTPLSALVMLGQDPNAMVRPNERQALARQLAAQQLQLGLSESLLDRVTAALNHSGPHSAPLSVMDQDRLRHLLHLCQSSAWNLTAPEAGQSHHGFDLHSAWPKLLGLVLLVSAGMALLLRRERVLRQQNQRQARSVCRISALLDRGDGQHIPTMIEDISRTGCRLRLDSAKLHSGMAVRLQIGTLGIGARLRWQNRHYAGLEFDPHLSTDQLAALLATHDRRSDLPPSPDDPMAHSKLVPALDDRRGG